MDGLRLKVADLTFAKAFRREGEPDKLYAKIPTAEAGGFKIVEVHNVREDVKLDPEEVVTLVDTKKRSREAIEKIRGGRF